MSYGSPFRTLSADQVREIRLAYRRWETLAAVRRQLLQQARALQQEINLCMPGRIAEQHGLSRDAIVKVAKHRHYKEIR